MKDIILVSHCMLNTFSKVESFGEEEGREEARFLEVINYEGYYTCISLYVKYFF